MMISLVLSVPSREYGIICFQNDVCWKESKIFNLVPVKLRGRIKRWFHPLTTCVVKVKERKTSVSAVYTFRDHSRTQENRGNFVLLRFYTADHIACKKILLQ